MYLYVIYCVSCHYLLVPLLEVKDVSLNVKVMALILNESKGKKNVKMNVNECIHVYSL